MIIIIVRYIITGSTQQFKLFTYLLQLCRTIFAVLSLLFLHFSKQATAVAWYDFSPVSNCIEIEPHYDYMASLSNLKYLC